MISILLLLLVLVKLGEGFVLDSISQKQVVIPTGQYFPLSALTNGTYYTITSSSDKVIATVALHHQNDIDDVLQNIHVFDGATLQSKLLGSLADVGFQNSSNKITSAGSSLSFFNMGSTISSSYLIGNEASTVSGFQSYSAAFTSLGEVINWELKDQSQLGSAYTFYCTNCDQFHWTTMTFDDLETGSNGLVSIQGMAPTQGMKKWVNYDYKSFNENQQLPQPIGANMFTVTVFNASISMNTTTSTDDTIKIGKKGRKLLIVSPSLWANGATPAFDYHFDSTTPMKYHVQFLSLVITPSDGIATVLIGSETYRFNSSLSAPMSLDGNGTKFRANYNGTDSQSGSVIEFEMNWMDSGSSNQFHLLFLVGFLTAYLLN